MRKFFKATDGLVTVFRATERAYASANFRTYLHEGVPHVGRSIGFSGKAVPLGQFPAVEITKAEYDHLTAVKQARIVAQGGSLKYSTSPSDSWVRNSQLEGEG